MAVRIAADILIHIVENIPETRIILPVIKAPLNDFLRKIFKLLLLKSIFLKYVKTQAPAIGINNGLAPAKEETNRVPNNLALSVKLNVSVPNIRAIIAKPPPSNSGPLTVRKSAK